MPAKDKYHDIVISALQKDGWTIADEQYVLVIENRVLWVDLLIAKPDEQQTILVEVKSFLSTSRVEDMANAVGKYLIYSAILEDSNNDLKLYLAVPHFAFEGIFSERLGELLIQKLQLSLIVFDPELEEITAWI